MSLHIAAVGDWTRSLYQLVKDGQDEQVSNPSLFPSDTCMPDFSAVTAWCHPTQRVCTRSLAHGAPGWHRLQRGTCMHG